MQITSALDIPEKELFTDQEGGLVIPKEPLVNLLRKFDDVSFYDVLAMQQQQHRDPTKSLEAKLAGIILCYTTINPCGILNKYNKNRYIIILTTYELN